MMKSFFKKLAFVMALAMVVTLAAPAATASAAEESPLKIAYQNGMAITEVNLMNADDFEDLRFLGVSNWKELGGAKWSSNNEAVATVNQSGLVTAKAEGTAVVSVAIGTMTASVTVNVGTLPTYNVTIGIPAEGLDATTEKTLTVGESVDFNFKGIKDYSRDKIGALPRYLCTWQSDDTTVLTKDNEAGLFTAVKAGTAKVTLTVANVLTGKTHNVVPVNVTVVDKVVEVEKTDFVVGNNGFNKTQNKVEIVFDKAVEVKDADVTMFRVFEADDDDNGDGKIDTPANFYKFEDFYVYDVNVTDEEKTTYLIETFDDFEDGVTYQIDVEGYDSVQFVASVGDVATVIVKEDGKATLETEDLELNPAKLWVELYDKNNVDVTTRKINGVANDDPSNVTFDVEDSVDYNLYYNEIEFYEDVTALVTATFERDDVEVTSKPTAVKARTPEDYSVEEIVAWTLVAPGKKADWTDLQKKVPAGEEGWTIATLLRDTRGDYFTTHAASASVDYVDKNGVKHDVEWTENEDAAFWANGLYVEYKAMDPDEMLVEDYGEIDTYKTGSSRYALYLYNYKLYNDEFVKELYSQYVEVCHPMKLKGIDGEKNYSIMVNTEDEAVVDAYYSLFSKTKVGVSLLDIHPELTAKQAHCDNAEFEVTLISNQLKGETDAQYARLKTLVEETYENMLYSYADADADGANDDWWYREIAVNANQYTNIVYRNQIKFKITELTTKSSINVTINLKKLVPTELRIDKWNYETMKFEKADITSELALVQEFEDKMNTNVYFQKFTLDGTSMDVQQKISNYRTEAKYLTGAHSFVLGQVDKAGNKIGVDSDIFVGTALKVTNINQVVNGTQLKVGDRVLTVKDPSGKIFSAVGTQYTNPAYIKALKDTRWATPATTGALGAMVTYVSEPAKNPADATTFYKQYNFIFAAEEPSIAGGNEMVYAKPGRYTISIQTVEDIDFNTYKFVADDAGTYVLNKTTGEYVLKADMEAAGVVFHADTTLYKIATDEDGNDVLNTGYGNIRFTSSTGLKATVTANVKNDNPEIKYAGRDLTRIEDTIDIVDATVKADDDFRMKTYILDAFNFKYENGSTWSEKRVDGVLVEGTTHLSTEDILYYTYTVTPTNKQIVINTVTFKVPVIYYAADGTPYYSGSWYRSTVEVNKSLTFSNEY